MDNLEEKREVETLGETDEQRKARRHREQEEGRKLQEERARASRLEEQLINFHVEKAQSDQTYLLDLYDRDPQVADKVAKKFQKEDGTRIRSFSEFAEYSAPGRKITHNQNREEFERWYEEKRKEEEVQTAKKVARDAFKHLTEEQREQAQEEFEYLSQGRHLTVDDGERIASIVAAKFPKSKRPVSGITPTSSYHTSEREPKERDETVKEMEKALGLEAILNFKKQ